MPQPRPSRALDFYRAGLQRFGDAKVLSEQQRLTGAFYLAGYGVECILKALILSAIHDPKRRADAERSFRGQSGHDIEKLRRQYVKESGRMIPGDVALNLARVQSWRTDLRYDTGVELSKHKGPESRKEVEAFLSAVAEILTWAGERINDGSSKTN